VDGISSDPHVVVGVDGSDASIEALRQAHKLAVPLGATIEASAYWNYPQAYAGYVAAGIGQFGKASGTILREAVEKAFAAELPDNVVSRLVRGHPRDMLIEASKDADMIVVDRRGHGGFGGLLLGSVGSAMAAHARCPVFVVHAPEDS